MTMFSLLSLLLIFKKILSIKDASFIFVVLFLCLFNILRSALSKVHDQFMVFTAIRRPHTDLSGFYGQGLAWK